MYGINKIIFFGFAYMHHRKSQGGYHHISEYLNYDTVISVQNEKNFFDITLRRNNLFKVIKRIYFFFFNQIGVTKLLKCIWLCQFSQNLIFHFIYPENTYAWLHFFIGKKNKIVLTLHQPKLFYLENKRWLNILKCVDDIIILNKSDLNFFIGVTGRNNVHYIPHGINTQYFKFNKKIFKQNRILMVGNWLRDFEFAANVFKKIVKDIEIVIITDNDNFTYFNGLNVRLLNTISDNELLFLYQSSKVVYYPLIDFSANNSLLEAAATGANILVSTNKIVDSSFYFPIELVTCLKNDIELVAMKLNEFIFDAFKFLTVACFGIASVDKWINKKND